MAAILECQIATNQNGFIQETFWHKVGSISTTGSRDIVIFMSMLFIVTAPEIVLDIQLICAMRRPTHYSVFACFGS